MHLLFQRMRERLEWSSGYALGTQRGRETRQRATGIQRKKLSGHGKVQLICQGI